MGNKTTYTVDVPDGFTYYFVVRAYSTGGLVSGNSNEVSTFVGVACTYSISPSSVSPAASGGTGSVAVSTQTGCQWTATSNAGWITVTSGASGSGNGTVGYSVAANTGSARNGTVTIAGQTFTVNQQGQSALPTLSLSPSPLSFGAVNTGGGTLSQKTPSQQVTVTKTGSGTVTWTATANRPWIQVTSGSGAGTGTFTVSVVNSGVLPATGTVTGTVTVTASGAQNSPTLPISLTLYPSGGTAMPFGQVDTPTQNATGVIGSIGVTGWALDDVGIQSVKLYRNCLAFEPATNCEWLGGNHVVFVGTADLVPGARPDVEAAYPTYPQAYRAAWGYLLLTNMLPHVPSGLMFGGQGSLSLHAYATDVEGRSRWLGRTVFDQTPTAITMANNTATKPFGAIDTPGQGQTISGTVWNFGWALTPDSNTVAGAGDILIPTNGSTIQVYVDGVAMGSVAYNQCRGTVAGPVPAGVYCDDDVSNIFGQTTPQPIYTSRTGNPTKYRNLDAGRGAMGAFSLDTTALSNGRHTIMWGVTDSTGRSEGIGSRYFVVLNGSGDAAAAADAPARVVGAAEELTWRPVAAGDVWGRVGLDPLTPWTAIGQLAGGSRHVRLPELGRVELYLGADVTTGYLHAGESLRALPPGSQLEAGHFTWAPGPGYVGEYALIFDKNGDQVPVTVTVQAASETSRIEAYVDTPRDGSTVAGPIVVAGWAADPTAWAGSGIGAVHVWAHRRDGSGAPPTFLGAAELGVWRPDVGVAIGSQFERAGWQLSAPALPPGEYEVVAYFWSQSTGRFEDARAVQVTVR